MEKTDPRRLLVPLIFLVLAVALMVNCGGGGGGGGSSAVPVSGTGTVAVYLTDSPADDYAEINILITEVSLIPENGGHLSSFLKNRVVYGETCWRSGMKRFCSLCVDTSLPVTIRK